MLRVVAVASFVGFAGVTLLAGCTVPQPVDVTAQARAPYDPVTNPACGALGNCTVTDPMRLNWTDLHGGGG